MKLPKDLISALDAILQVHLEGGKGDWALMTDLFYVKLSEKKGNIKLNAKQILLDFGCYYNLVFSCLGKKSNRLLTGDIFLGGRYQQFESKLDIAGILNTKAKEDWIDPVVGGRIKYNIKDRYIFSFVGNIGGFGLASNYTWRTDFVFSYKFNRYFGIVGAFRALGTNYKTGSGNDRFKYNLKQYGPAIGIAFTF